jgi:FAD/FMN-containing dehydrogenase
MTKIEEICLASQTAVVQAGATIESLQTAAQENGLFYPIDLGSKGTQGETGSSAGE